MPDSETQPEPRPRLSQYAQLTKARLSSLVLVTAAAGYLLGLPSGVNLIDAATELAAAMFAGEWSHAADIAFISIAAIEWVQFIIMLVGIGLAAAGTSAVNQWMEHDRDAAMKRTEDRPLPSGRMSRGEALLVGTGMILLGFALVLLFVNPLAAFLTILTALIYVAIYTPLKVRTSLNTLVGAICGAIPPMIGWAAASGTIGVGAWVLGGILFVWQLPHFLALAWVYREDYARGGFRMLPVHDTSGELTSRVILLTSFMLVPLTLMAVMFGVAGIVFAVIAVPLGLIFTWTAMRMHRDHSNSRARTVFFASIAYLPLVLGAMVIDQTRPPVRAVLFEAQLNQTDENKPQINTDENG